jgi:hypothetical protein
MRPSTTNESRRVKSRLVRNLVAAAVLAFALAPTAARAQWYSSYPQQAPLYPYSAQQPYAIQVAPGTYTIHRSAAGRRRAERATPDQVRRRTHNDPALIEELRSRSHVKHGVDGKVVQTTEVVREKPIVIVHKRVVDDPPRVIVRQHVIDDLPRGRGLLQPQPQEPTVEDLPPQLPPPARRHVVRHAERHKAVRVERHQAVRVATGDKRVIKADAEVTILGPDRMTIRLFRKGHSAEADARAE